MPVTATCPHCNRTYSLDDSLAGKKARCKECKNIVRSPQPPVGSGETEGEEGGEELSPAGIKIIRAPKEPPRRGPQAGGAAHTPYFEAICEHIERTIGPAPMVFHEIVSEGIHLDLLIVPPTNLEPSEEHPLGTNHFTIVTAGLSGAPQNVPDDARPDISPLQELMVALPADWPGINPDGTFDDTTIDREENWWPIGVLKMIARLPAEADTFIAPGVTIPNGEEAEPYASNTRFGCMMAFNPILSPNAHQLQVDDETRIDFYALWPLYKEEMDLKLNKGVEPLLNKMMEAQVSELVRLDRPSVVGKKKGWFGFGRGRKG